MEYIDRHFVDRARRVVEAEMLRRDLRRVAMQTVRQVRPHAYWPSAIHMGDCQVCGHVQSDAIHQAERVRSTPADPATQVPFSKE